MTQLPVSSILSLVIDIWKLLLHDHTRIEYGNSIHTYWELGSVVVYFYVAKNSTVLTLINSKCYKRVTSSQECKSAVLYCLAVFV